MPAIFRESESYYLIGFRPADPSANGKFHQITVKTARRGLDCPGPERLHGAERRRAAPLRRYRAGRFRADPRGIDRAAAGRGGAARVERRRRSRARPAKAAIALTVGVAAFAAAAARRQTRHRCGRSRIVATAFDRGGRPKGVARQTLELSWPAAAAVEGRFDVLSRLDLPPGEYQNPGRRVLEREARTASVFSYVTVPPFSAAPLSLSNIVVGATAGTLTAPRDSFAVAARRPDGAACIRGCRSAGCFFRIYQGTRGAIRWRRWSCDPRSSTRRDRWSPPRRPRWTPRSSRRPDRRLLRRAPARLARPRRIPPQSRRPWVRGLRGAPCGSSSARMTVV